MRSRLCVRYKPGNGSIILHKKNQSLGFQPGFLSILHSPIPSPSSATFCAQGLSHRVCAPPRPLPSPPPHIVHLPTSDKASSSLTHQVSISQRAHNTAPLRHLGLVVLLLFPRRRSSRLPSLKGPLAVMTTADECADSHNLLLFHPSSL